MQSEFFQIPLLPRGIHFFFRRVRMMIGRFLSLFLEQFSQYYCCDVYSDGFSAFCRQEEKPRLCNHSLFFAYFN